MPVFHTHYDNLFVTRNAPIEVIRAAYRALAQKYHPDKSKHPDAERIMKLVNEAWAILSDADLRREHDRDVAEKEETRNDINGYDTPRSQKGSEERNAKQSPSHSEEQPTPDQSDLVASLQPLAERLWFRNFSEDYVVNYLVSRGLSLANSEAVASKLFRI